MIISFGVRDATYFLDFSVHRYSASEDERSITDALLALPLAYEINHSEKFLGITVPEDLTKRCPQLCSRLWTELDIVPLVIQGHEGVHNAYWDQKKGASSRTIDELADSMSRRCIS